MILKSSILRDMAIREFVSLDNKQNYDLFFTFAIYFLHTHILNATIFKRPLHSKGRLYIPRYLSVCLSGHLNRFGQMNLVSKPFNYL